MSQIALLSLTWDAPFSLLTLPALRTPRRALTQASTLTLFIVFYQRMAETVSLCDLPQARAPHLLNRCDQPMAGDADVRCSVHAKRRMERVSASSR